ncbi:D-alpha,beta-D-heptose 7-phosphate 1-kinase /D-beta-D-heptose 1-phosphate adenylyltransferase [Panacagrimonas perspica]|uniref:Bifunctional protein HldE n=1 Tax=Panacagrimonas perspica TaxID=381431 RepID=A0A4S3K8Y0_9GAMM|nr:bifunctional D-glycero-beta-D-manno-heptose-7-phosphate kinase/D-glycero-beta-D-manno-heptose 1-phosphate adenylyltransferase HldE [Panacagrimonas perspica]TDU24345.1 D-alpha,beta-D-heptose 7-phosphate 1-kinase /D-beta-D-heptose 1-phosphate adenylyltransferase [Panacagrimonas perspica]THD04737.1 bifunctional heptose 7-phosphate kinase/heptose 1-phosphate adenyltransferase [Panacagrimonas perspica]
MYGIPDFSKTRLLVAGDVMLDRYWSGPTQRISPEAPVPVVRVGRDESRPGGAANVALNLAALGARASLLGVVGRDSPAASLAALLRLHAIEPDWVESPRLPTITKLRVLSRNQQVIRLDFEESYASQGAFDRAKLIERFTIGMADAQVAVLSDYAKGTLIDVAALIAQCQALKKPVVIDPKGNDFTRYRGATVLTPNLGELEAIVGACPDDATLIGKGARLINDLHLEALLVTRSEKGMTLLRPGKPPLHLPTEAREVFDVTGAGDTVVAALAAGLAAGQDLGDAVRLANVAAGIVVAKLGTATASRAELELALHRPAAGEESLLTEEQLLAKLATARSRGNTIVMTNGVFDLLHVGHVRYLEAARQRGDLLIVAVNEDDSVRRLKGPTRPVNSCADRMRVLGALKCVDYVVPFAEDTPERLIGRVLPDLLVKGGDYKPEQIAGYAAVKANGGDVVVLDFHEGYSTTSMLGRGAANP